ncbi:MAG TPA: SRPBCC family protein [Galbitalea sp.]|jgi:hypothetical protein|nr:SRPBCC family protein [Galbitalea sp.]
MPTELLISASVVIDRPILDVFKYIGNPEHLPEWVPFYSKAGPANPAGVTSGDHFRATFSMRRPFGPIMPQLPFASFFPIAQDIEIAVKVDDVVHGRRIAYRSQDVSWTTICEFEPAAGKTLLTTTHSLWSWYALALGHWLAPIQPFANDIVRRILDGLKRRLEGRREEAEPRIFFSYRRAHARYVGGRIFDALTDEFGRGTVFRDTDSLLAGGIFELEIEKALAKCDVLVAHIGEEWEREIAKRWQAEKRWKAQKSTTKIPDQVRSELEKALDHQIIVIPVFTSQDDRLSVFSRWMDIEATLRELPETSTLRKRFVAARQGLLLRNDPDFQQDLEMLMRAVWDGFRKVPQTKRIDSRS